MDMVVLPFLVQLSHVNQAILHLLQAPDLLPSTATSNLNRWFTEHSIPLHTQTHTCVVIGLAAQKADDICVQVSTCVCDGKVGLRLQEHHFCV